MASRKGNNEDCLAERVNEDNTMGMRDATTVAPGEVDTMDHLLERTDEDEPSEAEYATTAKV